MTLTRASLTRTVREMLPHVRLVKRGTGWALVRLPGMDVVATADSLREMADGVLLAFKAFERDYNAAPVVPDVGVGATNGDGAASGG